jgi:hypothetical protein
MNVILPRVRKLSLLLVGRVKSWKPAHLPILWTLSKRVRSLQQFNAGISVPLYIYPSAVVQRQEKDQNLRLKKMKPLSSPRDLSIP